MCRRTPMRVKLYGTRGTESVSGPDNIRYGGNTTCLRIYSDSIPSDTALVVDAGSGYRPMVREIMKGGRIKNIIVLFTHYHPDHTFSIMSASPTHIPNYRMRLIGPEEHGFGPRQMLETLMVPPIFPVHHKLVMSRFHCDGLEFPQTKVLLMHPEGGAKLMNVDELENLSKTPEARIPFSKSGRYPISDCLVVRMHESRHPESTISYRFEERTTERVFTFLTDHENTDGIPQSLRRHIKGSNLLIADAQYTEETYRTRTAGFGHGTPRYVTRLAAECGIYRVGLTHHDPESTDADIDAICREAHEAPYYHSDMEIFACADYQIIEI